MPPPLSWHSCSGGLQCATLKVPLDYSKPGGQQISLAIARLRASNPAGRIGSLLTNPGGPGESGITFLQDAATTFFSSALRAHFDIVSWDPRGVGASTAVQCLGNSQLDALFHIDPNFNTPDRVTTGLAAYQAFVNGCEQHSGSLLPHVSTEDSTRDIEQIRLALGETKISYLGFSYGTFLGALYAHMYPTHLRAIALDGAVDPNQTYAATAIAQTTGFEKDYQDYLAHCVTEKTQCAIYNSGNPGGLVDNLLAGLEARQIPVGTRSLGPSEALTGLLAGMYDPGYWDILSNALASANLGIGNALLELNDSYVERDASGNYTNTIEANLAINCVDYQTPKTTAAYQQLATQLAAISPHFGAVSAWSPCIYWPVPASPEVGNLSATGAPSVLIVSGTRDPATPLSWGQSLHSEIPGSTFLVRNGDGHVSYDKSTCAQGYIDAYLLTITLPPAGATC